MLSIDAIERRHSTRLFSKKKVSNEKLNKFFFAASLAPSSHNKQPWFFQKVINKEYIDKIADLNEKNKWVRTCENMIAIWSGEKELSDNDLLSLGAAIENLLLEATANEVQSCWIGGVQKKEVAKILKGKDVEYELIALIALGYEKIKLQPKMKKNIEELII